VLNPHDGVLINGVSIPAHGHLLFGPLGRMTESIHIESMHIVCVCAHNHYSVNMWLRESAIL